MKLSFLLLLLSIIFSSCATMEETANNDTETVPEDAETTQADDPKPDWYDYTTRFYADSVSFTGIGLASAIDANRAREQAVKQAIAHLKLSIDTYSETVRSEQAVQRGREEFTTTYFVLNLRNAIQELPIEDQLEITEEHIEKSDSVHHIYIKVEITREAAFRALDAQLNNSDFFQALNEQSAR